MKKVYNVNNAYLNQFPIKFQLLEFKENQEIEIVLIELTKNGRQKKIGYTKIVVNKKVIGEVTRHRIVGDKVECLEKGKQKDKEKNKSKSKGSSYEDLAA